MNIEVHLSCKIVTFAHNPASDSSRHPLVCFASTLRIRNWRVSSAKSIAIPVGGRWRSWSVYSGNPPNPPGIPRWRATIPPQPRPKVPRDTTKPTPADRGTPLRWPWSWRYHCWAYRDWSACQRDHRPALLRRRVRRAGRWADSGCGGRLARRPGGCRASLDRTRRPPGPSQRSRRPRSVRTCTDELCQFRQKTNKKNE